MPSKVKKTRRMVIMYICFAAVLIALVFSIVSRRSGRIHYGLPEIPKISLEQIDSITVKSGERGEISLSLVNSSWLIMPEGYKADSAALNNMLDAFTSFTITDLISTSGHYERYDLDNKNKLTVVASGNGEELISFDLGKRAPSYNHTYVALGDGQVYSAATDLRRVFEKDIDSLRSRLVLSFAKDEIVRIEASLPAAPLILTKSTPAVGTGGTTAQPATWKTPGGDIWETEIIDDLLGKLNALFCTSFADTLIAGEIEPLLTLKLQGHEEYRLTLLAEEETGYRASSSQTPHEFYLSSWQANNILDTFSDLETADR